MLRIARWLFVLSPAIAVPAQGVAAVTAGVCMATGHHEPNAAQALLHAQHADGTHGEQHSHGSGQEAAHCAPCVSCCAAASISAAPEAVPEVVRPIAVEAHPVTGTPEFLPARLERPPLAL
jgi:hypothetical protein